MLPPYFTYRSGKTDKDETRQIFTPAWTQSGHRSTDSVPKTPLDLHYQNSMSRQKSQAAPMGNKPRGRPPRPPSFIPRPPRLSSEHIKAAEAGAKLHIHKTADNKPYIHVHSNPGNKGQAAVSNWKSGTSPAPALNNFNRRKPHQASHVHSNNRHEAGIRNYPRGNPLEARYNQGRWARPSLQPTQVTESMLTEYSITASPKYTFKPVKGRDNRRPDSWANRNHRRTDFHSGHEHPSNLQVKGSQTGSKNTKLQHRDHNIQKMPSNIRSNLWYVPTTTTPKPTRTDLGESGRKDKRYSRYDLSYVPGLTKSPNIKKSGKPLSKSFFKAPISIRENSSRFADLGQLELMGMDLDPHGHPVTTSTTVYPPGAFDRFPLTQAGVISPRERELQSLNSIKNRLKQDAEENRFRRPAVFERFTQFQVGKKGNTKNSDKKHMQSHIGSGVNDISNPSKGPAYQQNPTIKIKGSVSSNVFNPFLSSIKKQPDLPAPNIHGVDFLRQKPLANEFTHTKHANTLDKGHIGSDTHGHSDGHGNIQGQGHSPVIMIENAKPGHGNAPLSGVLRLYAHNDTQPSMHNGRHGNLATTQLPQFQQHHQQGHGHAGASNLNIPAHHVQAHGNMNKVVLPNIDPQAYLNAGAGIQSNRQLPMTETDIQRQAGQIFEKTAPPVFNGVLSNMQGQTVAKPGFHDVTQPPANNQQQAFIEAVKSSILDSIDKANHQMQGQNVDLLSLQQQQASINPQNNVFTNWPQPNRQTQQSQLMNTVVVNNGQIPGGNSIQQMQTMNNFQQIPKYQQSQQAQITNYANANNSPQVPAMNNIAQIPNTNNVQQIQNTNNVQQMQNANKVQQMQNINSGQQISNMNGGLRMLNMNNAQQIPDVNNNQQRSNMNIVQQMPTMNNVQQLSSMNYGQQMPIMNNGQQTLQLNNGQQRSSMMNAQQMSNMNSNQQMSNINSVQQMPNMNSNQQVFNMNSMQQMPNMNNGQQMVNINSNQQMQKVSISQQMPILNGDVSQQFQYNGVKSQYQNSGSQNAPPNVRNQNIFPDQSFQNPLQNQPIQSVPTDQGTRGIFQNQDPSQTNPQTLNSFQNQGPDISFQSQGLSNIYQNQDNGGPFPNQGSIEPFQNQDQQVFQQGQGIYASQQNKGIKMVSLRHEDTKDGGQRMHQHQSFNHGNDNNDHIGSGKTSNPAYNIKAATLPSPQNVQPVDPMKQGNVYEQIEPTTTKPTPQPSTQSQIFNLETASAKQLVLEFRKLQALSKKGPLTYDQLQQRQALQIQLVKRVHEAQLKQLNKVNGSKQNKIKEKIQSISNVRSSTNSSTKSALMQSQDQSQQQQHLNHQEASVSMQQSNQQVNDHKHVQSKHHQHTIGNEESILAEHQHNHPNVGAEQQLSMPNMAVQQQYKQENMAGEHQHSQPNVVPEHQHNMQNIATGHQHKQLNVVAEHQHFQPNTFAENQHNMQNMAAEHQHNQTAMATVHRNNMQRHDQSKGDHFHTNDHSHDTNNLPVTADVIEQTTTARESTVHVTTGAQPALAQKNAMQKRLNSFVDKLANRMNKRVSETKAVGKLQDVQVSSVSREAIMKVLREMALDAMRKRAKSKENKMATQDKPTLSAVEVDYRITREAIKSKATKPSKIITKRSTPTLYDPGFTNRVQNLNRIQSASRPQGEMATIPMEINIGSSHDLVQTNRPTQIKHQAHLVHDRFAHPNDNQPTPIVQHPPNDRPIIYETHTGTVSFPTSLHNRYQPMQDVQTSLAWGQPEIARWNPSTTAFIDPEITEMMQQPQAQGYISIETVTSPTDFTTQAMQRANSKGFHNHVESVTKQHNLKEQFNSRTVSVTSATKTGYVPKINSDKKLTAHDITELGNEILQQMKKLILRQRG